MAALQRVWDPPELVEAPIFIDVEASGFGRGSYPIEVGVCLADGTTRCRLIQPVPDWTHWDAQAEAVHRIPRPLLYMRGVPVSSVAEELNAMLDGQTVYSDAWGQDAAWLAALFEQACRRQRFRLDSVRGLLGEGEVALWHPLKAEVERRLALTRHRASSDALILQMTWRDLAATKVPAGT